MYTPCAPAPGIDCPVGWNYDILTCTLLGSHQCFQSFIVCVLISWWWLADGTSSSPIGCPSGAIQTVRVCAHSLSLSHSLLSHCSSRASACTLIRVCAGHVVPVSGAVLHPAEQSRLLSLLEVLQMLLQSGLHRLQKCVLRCSVLLRAPVCCALAHCCAVCGVRVGGYWGLPSW